MDIVKKLPDDLLPIVRDYNMVSVEKVKEQKECMFEELIMSYFTPSDTPVFKLFRRNKHFMWGQRHMMKLFKMKVIRDRKYYRPYIRRGFVRYVIECFEHGLNDIIPYLICVFKNSDPINFRDIDEHSDDENESDEDEEYDEE